MTAPWALHATGSRRRPAVVTSLRPAWRAEKVYTRTGDDGTTGLLYGGRVRKDSELPTAYGAVDEAQAFLGLARAEAGARRPSWPSVIVAIERDLYVLMAELATLPENRRKLTPGTSAVTAAMVDAPRARRSTPPRERFEPPTEFVVPGETKVAALLDVARTVVRRAERHALVAAPPPSLVVTYLNRLSDLLWTLARWQEGHSLSVSPVGAAHDHHLRHRRHPAARPPTSVGIPVHSRRPRARGGLVADASSEPLGFRGSAGQRGARARSRSTSASASATPVTPAVLRTAAAALARASSPATVVATVAGRRRRRRPQGRGAGGGRGLRARLVPVPRA